LILDLRKDDTCQREAKRKGIKIIGVVDTNIDPTMTDYPILANDDAISSIKYILDQIRETILSSK
jgi:small subunit ribosomal protein S2